VSRMTRITSERGRTDLAKGVGEEEGLEKGVHIASRALVLESNVARFLFRVVATQRHAHRQLSRPILRRPQR
jgi:hypothetical protein